QRGNGGGVGRFSRRIGLVESRRAARSLINRHGGIRQTLAVGGLVVNERDLRVGEVLRQEPARDIALLVIAAAGAENSGAGTLFGKGRVRRSRRNLNNLFVGVDLRGRD